MSLIFFLSLSAFSELSHAWPFSAANLWILGMSLFLSVCFKGSCAGLSFGVSMLCFSYGSLTPQFEPPSETHGPNTEWALTSSSNPVFCLCGWVVAGDGLNTWAPATRAGALHGDSGSCLQPGLGYWEHSESDAPGGRSSPPAFFCCCPHSSCFIILHFKQIKINLRKILFKN